MNILKTLLEYEEIPKPIRDAIILIPLIIAFNTAYDGPYLHKQSLLTLVFLYGFCWLIWRLVLACFGFYTIPEMLQPVGFLMFSFVILVFMIMNFHYKMDKGDGISSEVMASNCPDAIWNVHINYDYNEGWLHASDSFCVTGNTKTAEEEATKGIEEWSKEHPKFKYVHHDLYLNYLPRKFCQEKDYPLSLSEIKHD